MFDCAVSENGLFNQIGGKVLLFRIAFISFNPTCSVNIIKSGCWPILKFVPEGIKI